MPKVINRNIVANLDNLPEILINNRSLVEDLSANLENLFDEAFMDGALGNNDTKEVILKEYLEDIQNVIFLALENVIYE